MTQLTHDALESYPVALEVVRPRMSVLRCPYLGLHWDAASTAMFPTTEHRCFVKHSRSVSLEHQAAHCLGQRFSDCEAFVKALEPILKPARKRPLLRLDSDFAVALAFAVMVPVVSFTVGFTLRWIGLA